MADGVLGWRSGTACLGALCALACGATTHNEARGGAGGSGAGTGGAATSEPLPVAGRANAGGDAGAPSVLDPMLDASGRWAQFGTDDAVAAELVQSKGVLTGNGCVMGLPTPADSAEHYCGAVHGQIQGAQVTFAYDATIAREGGELWLSSDGQRMAGRHAFDGAWYAPVSWLRIGATDRHLPNLPELELVAKALSSRTGRWSLTQLEGPEPLFLGRTDLGVYLFIQSGSRGGFVLGTLGAFWQGEMRWNEGESSLEIGPVPETVPGLPVYLRLHFVETTLQWVEATLSSGELQRFSASPQQ